MRFCQRNFLGLEWFVIGTLGLAITACKFDAGIGYNQGHSPEQPIPYSHELHVGKQEIQCQYCHNQVERSNHANIPATSTCMNCHTLVKTDSPFIAKLREAYQHDKPMEWIKVHRLPDFVKFSHAAHLGVGINCETCHGKVQEMAKIKQVATLSMGFCVECHRNNKAPTDCSRCHQ
ncbi:MAG: cytochrome C [Bdellovibrio sp.]|nr:MAG: cytochrome C [Bdellovibrio sp.]